MKRCRSSCSGRHLFRVSLYLIGTLAFFAGYAAPKPPLFVKVQGFDGNDSEPGSKNGRLDRIVITFDQPVDVIDNPPQPPFNCFLGGNPNNGVDPQGGGNPDDGLDCIIVQADDGGPVFEIAPGDYQRVGVMELELKLKERAVLADTGARLTVTYMHQDAHFIIAHEQIPVPPAESGAQIPLAGTINVPVGMLPNTTTTVAQYVDAAPPVIVRAIWMPVVPDPTDPQGERRLQSRYIVTLSERIDPKSLAETRPRDENPNGSQADRFPSPLNDFRIVLSNGNGASRQETSRFFDGSIPIGPLGSAPSQGHYLPLTPEQLSQGLQHLTILPGQGTVEPAIPRLTVGPGGRLYMDDSEWTRNHWIQFYDGYEDSQDIDRTDGCAFRDLPMAELKMDTTDTGGPAGVITVPHLPDPNASPVDPGPVAPKRGNLVNVTASQRVVISDGASVRIGSVETLDLDIDGEVDCYKVTFHNADPLQGLERPVKDSTFDVTKYDPNADATRQFFLAQSKDAQNKDRPVFWGADAAERQKMEIEGEDGDLVNDHILYLRIDTAKTKGQGRKIDTGAVGDFVGAVGLVLDYRGNTLEEIAKGNGLIERDKAPPVLKGIHTRDIDRNGKVDHLEFVWSERMRDDSYRAHKNTCRELDFTQEAVVSNPDGDIRDDPITYVRVQEQEAYNTDLLPLSYHADVGLFDDWAPVPNPSREVDLVNKPAAPRACVPLVFDSAPPILVGVTGTIGSRVLNVEFSEPVFGQNNFANLPQFPFPNLPFVPPGFPNPFQQPPQPSGPLQPDDFVLTDPDLRTIAEVQFAAGARKGRVILSKTVRRFGSITLAPAGGQIFDRAANAAPAVTLAPFDPDLPDKGLSGEVLEEGGRAGGGGGVCFAQGGGALPVAALPALALALIVLARRRARR